MAASRSKVMMDPKEKLSQVRSQLTELLAERRAVQEAPIDLETALAKMRGYITHLVDGYELRAGNFIHEAQGWPRGLLQPRQPGLNSFPDLEHFLAWLNPEQLSARFEQELRATYANLPLALNSEERVSRLGDLDKKLLTAEREEEELVLSLRGEGFDIERRPNVNIEVLLDVQ
jgi:Rad3-related DNA helicase